METAVLVATRPIGENAMAVANNTKKEATLNIVFNMVFKIYFMNSITCREIQNANLPKCHHPPALPLPTYLPTLLWWLLLSAASISIHPSSARARARAAIPRGGQNLS